MDALEELKRALELYGPLSGHQRSARGEGIAMGMLGSAALRHLPALIAELEARRAAMGEDITTRAGFSGQATEALR
jgi:hypothetical protein